MAEKKNNFFTAPNSIFDIGLTTPQLSVYLYLTRCGNNAIGAFPSLRTIQKKCSISRPTVTKTIDELESMGLIKKTRRWGEKGNESNVYTVVEPVRGGENDPSPGKVGLPPLVKDVYQGGKVSLPYKELPYKEPIDKENNTSNSSNSASLFLTEYPSNFKEEIEDALIFYYAMYKERIEKEHPRLKRDQLQNVYECIERTLYEFGDMDDMIQEFFNTVKQTDFNINHFCTDGMIRVLIERVR